MANLDIIALGQEFEIPLPAIDMLIKQLAIRLEEAKQVILEASMGDSSFKDKLIYLMDTRWKKTFALIGQTLSKKR